MVVGKRKKNGFWPRYGLTVKIAGGIAAICTAIILIPPTYAVVRWFIPASLGYVDDKVLLAQMPLLASNLDIQMVLAKNKAQSIQDDIDKLDLEVSTAKTQLEKTAKDIRRRKLVKDLAEQEDIIKGLKEAIKAARNK